MSTASEFALLPRLLTNSQICVSYALLTWSIAALAQSIPPVITAISAISSLADARKNSAALLSRKDLCLLGQSLTVFNATHLNLSLTIQQINATVFKDGKQDHTAHSFQAALMLIISVE